MLEKQIQSRVLSVFKTAGWYGVKVIMCNKNGFPDLMLFKDGHVFFIEVKQPGKKPTPLQAHRMRELSALGFECHVVSSVQQARAMVMTLGHGVDKL